MTLCQAMVIAALCPLFNLSFVSNNKTSKLVLKIWEHEGRIIHKVKLHDRVYVHISFVFFYFEVEEKYTKFASKFISLLSF